MSKKSKDVAVPRAVPIQRTDLSTFDDSFSFLKEKFTAEMQRMDDEMNKFSVNLMKLYGQQGSSSQPGQTSGTQNTWDALANSPLIQGEGSEKMIKLQFDMSSFEPGEIRVEVLNDKLLVYAKHEQKTDNLESSREFRRDFVLPHGIDLNTIISSLSRDGVLTVQAPLPQLVAPPERQKVLSKADKRQKVTEDPDVVATPAALTNQVPQEPLSAVSPASPDLPAGKAPSHTSPTAATPNKTSKTPSKISKPASK